MTAGWMPQEGSDTYYRWKRMALDYKEGMPLKDVALKYNMKPASVKSIATKWNLGKGHKRISITLPLEFTNELELAGKRRGISSVKLCSELIYHTIRSDLIDAILDDGADDGI